MAGAWVYILECSDGSFYTGLTKQEDPEGRVWEHNNRVYKDAYTSTRLPVKLAYAEHYELIIEVIAAERRIKGCACQEARWELSVWRMLRGIAAQCTSA